MSKKQSDKATKKRVKATASSTAKTPTGSEETSAKTAKTLAPDPRLPAVGTTIEKRDRSGSVRCTCTVEQDGIRYAGKVYTSLSGAAMAAAKDLDLKNKTQNGYVFWGLIKPSRPAGDPLAALERAWARYRDRVQALVNGVTDENRSKVASALVGHARAIETLAG